MVSNTRLGTQIKGAKVGIPITQQPAKSSERIVTPKSWNESLHDMTDSESSHQQADEKLQSTARPLRQSGEV
jgi:hypothetical protein